MTIRTHENTIRQPRKRPSQTGMLVGVRMQPDMLRLLDDWRREEEDLPSRPDAIRRLVEFALKHGGR